jgi:hypothetical protein
MTPAEFWEILRTMPEPKPIYYRLYYSDDGAPICYSMEDLPGNYIDIDSETYGRQPWNVRVIRGRLVEKRNSIKLRPSSQGVACDPRDVCVIVDDTQKHIRWNR